MDATLKRTPLFQQHTNLGGKIVPFAGWELPVQYSGVIAEHRAVREQAGLFDVSHMGELLVTGPEAQKLIDYLTCNDLSKLYDGRAQYNAIINPAGGVVDDIIVYRYGPERFFVCVNASNSDKDFAWITKHITSKANTFKAKVENLSSQYGQIAIQGPKAISILAKLKGVEDVADIGYFHFKDKQILGIPCIVARTGYTGEDGAEIFTPWNDTAIIWNALLEAGKADGLIPTGLGARDSLRLEACYPLHGHELGDEISAIESGLSWIAKPAKGDFIGRAVIESHIKQGAPRSLVGFFVEDQGIVRAEDKLLSEQGSPIGMCTSGTKTPTVNRALGMALVDSKFAKVGTKFFADVRGRKLSCVVVKRPFYSALKK